jgi:ribose transport system permease protein
MSKKETTVLAGNNSGTGIANHIFKSNSAVLVLVLIGVIVLFTIIKPAYFSTDTFVNILSAAVTVGLLAIGQTYLIIAGHIDLSAAYLAALAGVILALLLQAGMFLWLAIPITFGVAVSAALGNAALVNTFKLQPFIATLATASVFKGLAYLICDGKPVMIENQALIFMGTGKEVLYVPIPVIIMIALFIIFGFVLARTTFGRSVYMIGGNVTAARLAGLRPKIISTKLYIISSGIAALAGMLNAGRMHAGTPTAMQHAEFDAITAVVLGGVAFSGGKGTIVGAFIGLMIIQCFNYGLNSVGVSSFWQIVAKGLLLIMALIFDYFRVSKVKV